MRTKRILVMQDLSCLGQCSLTVSLPVLSALGLEACPLPTTLLSTHTVGFDGYVREELAAQDNAILEHFKRLNIRFDGMYAGYFGDRRHIAVAASALELVRGKFVLDPAMADSALYPGLDAAYVEATRSLAGRADVLLPNLTEAALLAGEDPAALQSASDNGVREEGAEFTRLDDVISRLHALGSRAVIVTGVPEGDEWLGVVVSDGKERRTYMRKRYARKCHGAGDVFASAFSGIYLSGCDLFDSAEAALDFTHKSIEGTLDDEQHWYGLHFEAQIPDLICAASQLPRRLSE